MAARVPGRVYWPDTRDGDGGSDDSAAVPTRRSRGNVTMEFLRPGGQEDGLMRGYEKILDAVRVAARRKATTG